jgi:hypothetical protein
MLDSEDPLMHKKFQSLVLSNEERFTGGNTGGAALGEDEGSYYKAIGRIIKMHENLLEFGTWSEADNEEDRAQLNVEDDESNNMMAVSP